MATETTQRPRQLPPKGMLATRYVAIATGLYHVVFVSGIVGIFTYIPVPSFSAFSLASLLTLTFLITPHTQKRLVTNLPWFDVVLILFSIVPATYFGLAYDAIMHQIGLATLVQQVLGAFLIIAVLEAVRRATTWVLSVLIILFLIYPFTAAYIPGVLHGANYSFPRVLSMLFLFPEGMMGDLTVLTSQVIMMFIIFGSFLEVSGLSDYFIDITKSIFGRFKAGAPLAAVSGSGLFGMVSGSAVANAATVGVITIPLMKKTGLSSEFAGAVEAASSTGGQLMPPVMGAAAFIMADFLGMPYWTLCIAAAVPSLLFYSTLGLSVIWEVDRVGLGRLPKEEIPSFLKIMTRAWVNFIPLIVLIYFLMVPRLTAETCVFYGFISLVAIMLVRLIRQGETGGLSRRLRKILSVFAEALARGGYGGVTIMAPAVGSAMIVGIMHLTALGLTLSSELIVLSGQSILVLAGLTAISSIILGMAVPTFPCYIMVAILLAPGLVRMGVTPLAAHMFVFYYALAANVTPPVAIATYVAAGIAKADMFKTGWQAMKVGFAVYLIPFVFLLNPAIFLVVGGDFASALVSVGVTLCGIILVVSALSGRLRTLVVFNLVERVLLFVAGIALAIDIGNVLLVDLSATALAIIVFGEAFLRTRLARRPKMS